MNPEPHDAAAHMPAWLGPRALLVLFAALLLLAGIGAYARSARESGAVSPNSAPPSRAVATAAPSVEYQLATINAGETVPRDDLTVTRFRYLLDTIHARTGETDQRIADLTVNGQDVCRTKYGKSVKLLDLMEAANKWQASSGGGSTYAQAVAALAVSYCSQ